MCASSFEFDRVSSRAADLTDSDRDAVGGAERAPCCMSQP